MSSPADQPAPGVGHDPAVAARVEQLYASHAALVRSICRSLLRDRLDAADAVQQTFLSAQQALANGTSPRDGAAWLATIARHECLARMRARMREPLPIELEERDAAPDAHTAAVRRKEADELRKALADLPAQQRDAILLREVRGLSYQEVASSLSLTTSAVESLLFRARRNLQTRLREALAALSPGWVQPLRELAVRIGNAGDVAPTTAKVATVAASAALFAGGTLTPAVMGLGHAPNSGRHASPPPAHRIVHAVLRKDAPREAPVQPLRASTGAHQRGGNRRKTSGASNTAGVFSGVAHSSDAGEGSASAGVHHDDGGDRGASRDASGSSDDSSGDDSSEQDGAASDDSNGHDTASSATTSGTTTTGTTTTDPITTDD